MLKVLVGALAFLFIYLLLSGRVFAGVEEILEGVVPYKTGICMMKKDGTLVAEEKDLAYIRSCVLGIKENTLYVVTFKDGEMDSIISGLSSTTQKVIWRKGEVGI